MSDGNGNGAQPIQLKPKDFESDQMNLAELSKLVRAEFLVDVVGYNRIRGLPLRSGDLADAIRAMV